MTPPPVPRNTTHAAGCCCTRTVGGLCCKPGRRNPSDGYAPGAASRENRPRAWRCPRVHAGPTAVRMTYP